MINNELNQLKFDYKALKENAFIVGESNRVFEILKNIDDLKSGESPDIYLQRENETIGIEVFEFSAYKTTKKTGNLMKLKEEEISKENLEMHIKNKKNYFCTEIKTVMGLQEYEKNFIDVFEKHYNKIDKYKENLFKYSENVKIYFFIKDTTVFGNTIKYNNVPRYYYPLMNENILNFLRNKKDVEGIIFQCEAIYNKKIYFCFENTEKNINEIYEENKCFFNIELDKGNFTKIESFL